MEAESFEDGSKSILAKVPQPDLVCKSTIKKDDGTLYRVQQSSLGNFIWQWVLE